MRLRFVDVKCKKCDYVTEVAVYDDDPYPRHCGNKAMERVWLGSPTIDYKRQYSHALGAKVSSTRELDRKLEAKGQWIATKAEANSTYGTDVFTDNVAIRQANDDMRRDAAEKAARQLTRDGVIRSGKDGWKWTGPTD